MDITDPNTGEVVGKIEGFEQPMGGMTQITLVYSLNNQPGWLFKSALQMPIVTSAPPQVN